MRLFTLLLLLVHSINAFSSMRFLSRLTKPQNLLPFQTLSYKPIQQRFFSNTAEDNQDSSKLSEKDVKRIELIINSQMNQFYKKAKDESHWDLNYSQKKMIQSIEEQGYCKDDSKKIFTDLDNFIDQQRRVWNFPYYVALGITAISMPATYLLVYNESFYTATLELFPWLEHTSWDWSEPLVQSLLTTQTQSAIIFASLMALGFRPYSHYRNSQLAKKIHQKWNIPLETTKRFIKVDK